MKNVTLALTVLSVASAATAQDLLWDNYPFGADGGLTSSQLDLIYPFDSQVADDFVGGFTVNHVEWDGGFWNGSPVDIPDWNIIFYADAGGAPVGGPTDPTGDALYHYVISGSAVDIVDNGDMRYTYNVDIPDTAFADGTFWVAIQPVFGFPPQWGIAGALDSQQGSMMHTGFPLLGTDYWTPGEGDMAFRLYGVPAPGALALLGLAGLVGRRRR